MGIVDEDIQKVRDATDMVGLVSQYTQLKRVGSRMVGLCPFHNEKSGSFNVNVEEGLYKCFGCGVGGDAITFVREIENLDFVGALEFLAGRAGVQLRYTDANEGEGRRRRKKLIAAVGEAVDFYHDRLLTHPDGGEARSYLRSRGYDGEIVRRFRIGWAPEEWTALSTVVKLTNDDWVESGLGGLNKRGGKYDFFRGRVLFPIFDESNEPIGFGGRILPSSDDNAKYVNTSDKSAIYNKSQVLYGLNWAKAAIAGTGLAVVCEGYTDVIGFAISGEERAVATCGTSLTEDHVRKLRKYAPKIVLAFDADAAGQAAAERFYEWEQRYEVDVFVADLPAGVDPGDLARTDPVRLKASIDNAQTFLGFRLDRALGAADLTSPEGRARAAEHAVAIVRQHPSDLVRDQYVMSISDRCHIDADRLRDRMRGAGRPIRVPSTAPTSRSTYSPEHQALRLLVHRPDDLYPHLRGVLFRTELYRQAYELLADGKHVRDVIDRAHPDVADLLTSVAAEEPDDDPAGVLTRLVSLEAQRVVCALEEEATGSDDLAAYLPSITWLRTQIIDLREPRTELDDLDPLVDWLVGNSGDWSR